MIGLTGGIASGKSTVAARLRELGAFVADADLISREVIETPEVRESIRGRFGSSVFLPEGTLDRRALAAAVFSAEEGAAALNSIMHPAIAKKLSVLARDAEASGLYPLVFTDAALLIESGFYELCDGVWLVTADKGERILRIMARDGLTREEAEARISRQMTDEEKAAFATTVIENDGSIAELIEKADEAFRIELAQRNPSWYEHSPDNDTYIKELTGAYETDE